MTSNRITCDTSRTINRQQDENQKEQYIESSSTAASTSSATRACARAREAIQEADARAALLHGQYIDCCEYYAASFHRGVPAGIQREIATRIKGGMSAEVIRAAIDDTMMAPRPSWAYCSAILRNCDLDNVKTLADWHARKQRRKSSNNPALQYEQRHYTNDDYGTDFFINLEKYGEEC